MGSRLSWRREELVYCSNVHPGESLHGVNKTIAGPIAHVRRSRSLPRMGAGVWLSRAAADELDGSVSALGDFRAGLDANAIDVFTLNGFPYGDFHQAVVKERVYLPDWSQTERLDYTLKLARILSAILPSACTEGTISTLPLGYRKTWSAERQRPAREALCRLAAALARLREDTGKSVRVCLEMEPDCVLETTPQTIEFLAEQLPRTAQTLGIDTDTLQQHLGVCFDVCHQSVMFEDPLESLQALHAAGIAIGKIQISSALVVTDPAEGTTRDRLAEYAEPRYLHQVRAHIDDAIVGMEDLPPALTDNRLQEADAWRVHFHVPIQSDSVEPGLETTRDGIQRSIEFLAMTPDVRPHLEVETYTWQVLPAALRPSSEHELAAGIAGELAWLEAVLSRHGLLEPCA